MHKLRLQPTDLPGRMTLITGDVNTGKTTLTVRLAAALARLVGGDRVTVVDFAPDMASVHSHAGVKTGGVGGRLRLATPGVRHLSAELVPPRLSARNDDHAWSIAQANLLRIVELFERAALQPRDVLVINDLSMYLQAADVDSLLRHIRRATGTTGNARPTLLANGYMGAMLGSGKFTDAEQARMLEFSRRCHRVVRF